MPTRPRQYEQLIGWRLRSLRKGRKWALKEVAAELRVSVTTVSDWERGTRFPSGDHLLNLAKLHETSVCKLLCAGKGVCPSYPCVDRI
ncbi:MAG: helix-turn-helix domain-containing protein [Lentisphaerae bacterium]|nr:helix-turn-helix domain-containing protein [Lentisphaerota bacterium]